MRIGSKMTRATFHAFFQENTKSFQKSEISSFWKTCANNWRISVDTFLGISIMIRHVFTHENVPNSFSPLLYRFLGAVSARAKIVGSAFVPLGHIFFLSNAIQYVTSVIWWLPPNAKVRKSKFFWKISGSEIKLK